jgi:hypothetical protein
MTAFQDGDAGLKTHETFYMYLCIELDAWREGLLPEWRLLPKPVGGDLRLEFCSLMITKLRVIQCGIS